METFTLTVPPEATGERLDRFLAAGLPARDRAGGAEETLSRSRLKALVEDGHASLDGATIRDPNHRVKPGQIVALDVPEAAPAIPRGQAIALTVVHEDAHIIVVDKPAGLVVHPAPGNPDGTLVNALIAHCGESLSGVGGVRRPGIVHRIDKDTSGLLVAAKHDAAHQALSARFAAHDIERLYRAVARGVPVPLLGTIEAAIGRDKRDRQRMAVRADGKRAVTHYRVEARYGEKASLVACTLETGRTHQIRVHLASLGTPIIGDPLYNRRGGVAFGRQALHAAVLGFEHPVDGRTMRFESPLPADMVRLIEGLAKGPA